MKEIKTERLLLKPASLEDLTTLNEIYKQVKEYFYFEGKEIVAAVCEYYKDIGFNEVRLGVSLKNWSGLVFWYKCGFDKITLVVGDDKFSTNGYACMELKKMLV